MDYGFVGMFGHHLNLSRGITKMVKHEISVTELEDILDSEPGSIEIQPDGSIKVVDGEPHHAKPRILTLKQVLGGTY